MKKTISKLLSFSLSVILAFGCMSCVSVVSFAASASDLTFELNDDGKSYCVSDCTSFAFGTITIPDTYNGKPVTSIGDSAFEGCSGLTSITIPNGVTSIGDCAFEGCTGLTSITIPNSVTSIGNSAFWGCTGLTSITIPNGVTSIGWFAFWRCTGLTSITIPNSVTSIGGSTFQGCTGLTSITIPNGVTSIGSDTFSGCTGLTSITIPNGVTSIGDSAFEGCSGLTSITIPNGVTSIGGSAFEGCSGLTSITIPNGVTSIGGSAFEGCTGLTQITVDSGNSKYSSVDGVLFNKAKTELIRCPEVRKGKYTIPNGVTSIGDGAFEDCTGLTSITIPNGVTSIGGYTFRGCTGLTSITIPNSVTSIGDWAFVGCSGLTSITIPNGVTSIGGYTFRGCTGLTSITIPNSVTSIGYMAFEGCSGLTSITIPNGVTSIGSDTFSGCTGLTSITIPNSVTSIGDYTFWGCTGLTSITIPNSVTSIGDWAFDGCTGLTSITIPNSVTSIGDWAFVGCSGLTSITIPNSVTSIGYSAFRSCTGLTSITIPNSVTSIDDYAFLWCDKLTISCYKNSAAHKYAVDNDIKYKLLDEAVLSASKLTSIANTSTGVTVKWAKVTGATGYYVYRKAGTAKGWSRIATISNVNTVSYTDKNVKSGTDYTYTVRAYNAKQSGAYNKTGLKIKFLSMPKVTLANAAKAVTVKWNKIAGATGYIVYRKAGSAKSWTKVATISKNATVTYTDKNVKSGTNYTYTVKAYYGKVYSAYNTKGVAIKFIAPTVLNSAVSGKTGITLKYSKVSAGTGYVIYRKSTGGYSKLATVSGNSKLTYLDKTAKKGVTYTYVVRAYNGKFMSANSNAKACKDKY